MGAASLLRRRLDLRGPRRAAAVARRPACDEPRRAADARRRRRRPGVRQHVPAPGPRAAARRSRGGRSPRERQGDRLPVPLLDLRAVRRAARRSGVPGRTRLRRVPVAADRAALGRVARADLYRHVGRRGGRSPARGPRRAGLPLRARAARGGRHARLRRRRQLEDPERELPGVLPLPLDPPGALPGQPAPQRRELPGCRVVDRRLDEAARRHGDDVTRRAQRRRPAARPVRCGAANGGVRRDLSQRPAQPPPRLRHDAHPAARLREPDHRGLHLGVRAGSGRASGVRPWLRGRLLGPHQPAGLGRVRVGAAGPGVAVRGRRAARAARGRRVLVRDHGRARVPWRAGHGAGPGRSGVTAPRTWPPGPRPARSRRRSSPPPPGRSRPPAW